MASAAVFAVTELLEDILSRLDFYELLVVRGVSRDWLAAIEQSLQLKRTLYLAPTSNTTLNKSKPVSLTIRPTLLNMAPWSKTNSFSILPIFGKWTWFLGNHSRAGGLYLAIRRTPRWDSPDIERDVIQYFFEWKMGCMLKPSSRWGVWRKMYLTQPPCAAVVVELAYYGRFEMERIRASIHVPDGVTLGAIAGTFEAMLRSVDVKVDGLGDVRLSVCFLVEVE
ncbi:hypothetical protein LTR56_017058 [Elasticomyces elasticus]|nr:hypothetical protein LTR56_017058 [Elasticomyces elasticus]KAK3643812.1 hypothetical protein LTR22_015549 [Elasticomyces elasticus]KAK4912668.1 hypothetical protein LTR49_018937 [Elasticomyces elasticus]KAK5752110.1 hypothetical protein LTS12_017789 [Elasticomyces elasticus]